MLLPDVGFNPLEMRMTGSGDKAVLHRYLQSGRDALLWKLEGLSEHDQRRPMTPTGTNLLGLVKHLAGVEAGYFGATFGRPFPEPLPADDDDAEPNADMWATADEPAADVVDLYRRVWQHADATIDALAPDAPGAVAWWPPERRDVTLQQVLVHVVAETHRHAGHADVARELVDGAAGLRDGNTNLPGGDAAWWGAYRDRLEQVARQFAPSPRPSPKQLAEAFSGHRFEEVYEHLADDVRWVLPGGPDLVGRDAVVAACTASAAGMAQLASATFARFVCLADGRTAAVDAIGHYRSADGALSVVSSADVYEFDDDGRVATITSYTVELPS